MPRFRKHSECPDCKLGRTINGFPCFCPASHSRAFKVVDQPPPAARHVIQQIIVGEQHYQTPHAALFAAAMSGRSYAASMKNHGDLRGLLPGIEVQAFNASADLSSGEIEVTPSLDSMAFYC
jgi:hypothetical protein